jgi:hypothetical protein
MFMSPLVVGLAAISSGCASMHSPATPSAADKQTSEIQQKQEENQQQPASKNDPVAESVFIASGLAQIGGYLFDGK